MSIMGRASKQKGKRGELELARQLRKLDILDARRSQQYCGAESSADIVGAPMVHIECKRSERLSLYDAYNQAAKDTGDSGNLPVLVHRRSRLPWLTIMSLDDWIKFYKAYIIQCTDS